jgi:hypothetical protein
MAGIGCLDGTGVRLAHLMPTRDAGRERRAEDAARPAAPREVLHAGSARARRIATETLAEAKAAVGIAR